MTLYPRIYSSQIYSIIIISVLKLLVRIATSGNISKEPLVITLRLPLLFSVSYYQDLYSSWLRQNLSSVWPSLSDNIQAQFLLAFWTSTSIVFFIRELLDPSSILHCSIILKKIQFPSFINPKVSYVLRRVKSDYLALCLRLYIPLDDFISGYLYRQFISAFIPLSICFILTIFSLMTTPNFYCFIYISHSKTFWHLVFENTIPKLLASIYIKILCWDLFLIFTGFNFILVVSWLPVSQMPYLVHFYWITIVCLMSILPFKAWSLYRYSDEHNIASNY